MRNGQDRYTRIYLMRVSSAFVLFYLTALVPWSNAQNTIENMSVTLTPSLSMTTFATTFSSISSFNSTSTSSSQPTLPPGVAPNTPSSDDDSNDQRSDAVFNYYFLFLVAFGILLLVLIWWLHQQQKRRKERMQLGGQNALARDLEGWTGPRRFLHGRYARDNHAAMIRREEGLNEDGEAPPPYYPKAEDTTTRQTLDGGADSSGGIAVPLMTLSTNEAERTFPPAYHNPSQTRENERAIPSPS